MNNKMHNQHVNEHITNLNQPFRLGTKKNSNYSVVIEAKSADIKRGLSKDFMSLSINKKYFLINKYIKMIFVIGNKVGGHTVFRVS